MIFVSTNPSGIFDGIRQVCPPEKRLTSKITYFKDENSPSYPTGGTYYLNTVLANRFVAAATGAWE